MPFLTSVTILLSQREQIRRRE